MKKRKKVEHYKKFLCIIVVWSHTIPIYFDSEFCFRLLLQKHLCHQLKFHKCCPKGHSLSNWVDIYPFYVLCNGMGINLLKNICQNYNVNWRKHETNIAVPAFTGISIKKVTRNWRHIQFHAQLLLRVLMIFILENIDQNSDWIKK